MKGPTLNGWVALTLFALFTPTAFAGTPDGGIGRATVTVTAYVLPKSTCTLGVSSPGTTDLKAVRCETPTAHPRPVVRMEQVESERSGAPKAVLTVLP